jgi:hypothetical protein
MTTTRHLTYDGETGEIVGDALLVDNGDGTGTHTTYDEHGNETSVEQVTGLPIPDLPADPDLIPPDPTRLRSPR